jgi:predicted PurR-regulated permease PerM
MILSAENAPAYLGDKALLLLLVIVSAVFGWILLPFYGTILWGGIIALVFAPVYRRFLPWFRYRRTPAALLTLLVAVVIVVVPFAIVSAALAREAMLVYERVQSGEWNPALHLHGLFDALPASVMALLDRFGLADFDTLQRRLTTGVVQGSQFIATRALGIGQDTFEFVAELFITTYVAFFLIRDGDSTVRAVRRAIPLAPEHKRELFAKFTTVVRATVKGNLLVAALQGALGGIAFWALDVSAALMWGVLMAFLSLLPAVGAALVWLPVAIYLYLAGALWQSIALLAYGVLVIGLVDNLLRPILVGKDSRMPDYVVMVTTLGGMAVFGINGFVLGPAIGAMFIAVWHIYAATQVAS